MSYEICQKSNSASCHRTRSNIHITASNIQRQGKKYGKYNKSRMQKLKKIETDCSRGFLKLISLTVFPQSSFLLFVSFDFMLGRHIRVKRTCNVATDE